MPIESLSPRQSQAWKDRVLPPVEPVGEGVWAIPVPIPDNPLVYTYCYGLADGDGIVLIDPGWDGDDRFRALTSALESIGFSVADVRGIAITHYHRDHIGLVPAVLAANPDAWVAMHGEDIRALERFYSRTVDLGTGVDPNLNIAHAYGVPQERWSEVESLQVRNKSDRMPTILGSGGLPRNVIVLADGSVLPMEGTGLTARWTPGHTYGHSVFVRDEGGLLFSGDHVLPTITPNIGLDGGAITHSLGDYLGSLDTISALPNDTSVLPAHGFRFTGLHERTRELKDHHAERLDEIRVRMDETDDHSVYSIAQGLHWSRGFDQLHHFNLFAALAETAAHMHYLDIDLGIGSLVPDEKPASDEKGV